MLCAVLHAAPAATDSVEIYEYPDGRTVAPVQSEDIAMIAETVLIVPAGQTDEWNPLMRVECLFLLENTSGEPRTISVGFPFDAKFGSAYTAMDDKWLIATLEQSAEESDDPWVAGSDGSALIPDVLSFRAAVDGEPVPVSFRKLDRRAGEGFLWYPVMATWSMSFEPGQVRRLENSYVTGWDFFAGLDQASSSLRYVMTSGAGWAGPIGRGLVRVIVPEGIPRQQYSDSLICYWDVSSGASSRGDTLEWAFTALEPTSDVEISARYRYWTEGIYYLTDMMDLASGLSNLTWEEGSVYASIMGLLAEDIWDPIRPDQVLMCCCNAIYSDLGLEIPYPWTDGLLRRAEDATPASALPEPGAGRIRMLEAWLGRFEEARRLAEDAGYMEFLPLFTEKVRWDEQDLMRYDGYPARERLYLELLACLEDAVEGRAIENEAIRAFYLLTGWYTGLGQTELAIYIEPLGRDLVAARRAEPGY